MKNDSKIKTATTNKKWEYLYKNTKVIPDISRKIAVAKFRLLMYMTILLTTP